MTRDRPCHKRPTLHLTQPLIRAGQGSQGWQTGQAGRKGRGQTGQTGQAWVLEALGGSGRVPRWWWCGWAREGTTGVPRLRVRTGRPCDYAGGTSIPRYIDTSAHLYGVHSWPVPSLPLCAPGHLLPPSRSRTSTAYRHYSGLDQYRGN